MTDPVMGLLALLALMSEQGQAGPPGPPGAAPPTPGVPPTVPSTPPGAGPVTPGTTPPMPPWPTAPVPRTLPPFPGPGWCPDTPVTNAIAARAAYWNQFLWDFPSKTIRRAFVQEQFGGQWITFAAAWHPGNAGPKTFMATEAWRTCTSPSPAPQPVPTTSSVVTAAQAMNASLLAHGYKQADQPVYKAFQRAANLPVDGFPGLHTMAVLAQVLRGAGQTLAPVKQYPWSSSGPYDGVNAPTTAEWKGTAPTPTVPTVPLPGAPGTMPTGGFPAPVSPYPGAGAYANNAGYISRYQYALKWLAGITGHHEFDPGAVDGKYGPNTIAAVKAFQTSTQLPVDGQAGAKTAAALDALVHSTAPLAT